MTETEQIEALVKEIAALRAQVDEGNQLVEHLRARTSTLNYEVRVRDAMIAEQSRTIAALDLPVRRARQKPAAEDT